MKISAGASSTVITREMGMGAYQVKVFLVFEQVDESDDPLMTNAPEDEGFHRNQLRTRCLD